MVNRYIIDLDKPMKTERNRLLREYYALHPYLTYAQVGEIFNISRQRVERIINGEETEGENGKD